MKKKKLEFDYTYDFELLGLRTSAKGYKLAWELNANLNCQLKKIEDLIVSNHNLIPSTSSFDSFIHQTHHNLLRLFKNRANESDQNPNYLIPEHPHFDFLLMIQGNEFDSNRLRKELLTIPSIELVAFIPLDTLKSKDNFIF